MHAFDSVIDGVHFGNKVWCGVRVVVLEAVQLCNRGVDFWDNYVVDVYPEGGVAFYFREEEAMWDEFAEVLDVRVPVVFVGVDVGWMVGICCVRSVVFGTWCLFDHFDIDGVGVGIVDSLVPQIVFVF